MEGTWQSWERFLVAEAPNKQWFAYSFWRYGGPSTQYSSDPAFWDKGIEIIVLKEMQGRSTQATRDFDVCYVFNLKIWLRTSIVL